MAVRIHLLLAFACIILSALVQAQFPWGSWGGRTEPGDDDDNWDQNPRPPQPPPKPAQQQPGGWGQQPGGGWGQQPGGGWGQQPQQRPPPPQQPGGGWGQQRPPPPQGGGGWQPQQPQQPQQPKPQQGPPRVTITITNYGKGGPPKQTPPPQPGIPQQRPPPQTPQGPRWTAPSVWGPQRTSPFGATQTGPQTIPTTTTDPPKEPVPFIAICGRNRYVEDDISNAVVAACYYKNKTQSVNNSGYPKAFPNTQRFNFGSIFGPWWEFPLISSAAYVGGPAGPDRVVINQNCWLAGEVTETGAGGKGFAACKELF